MSATVVGNSPIAFTSQDGKLLLIPLSAIYFDDKREINFIPDYPGYKQYKAEVKSWLQYLVRTGVLTSGEEAPPKPAMKIQAADSGVAGNEIQVVFSNIVTDPAHPTDQDKITFDATITEQNIYTDLSFDPAAPSFIKKVLGTEKTTGTQLGLVHVKDADTPSLPKAGIYSLTGGNTSTKSSVPILGDPSGTTFNVEAKKAGEDGDKTKVTISNVNKDAKTFMLTAVWTQTVTGIKRTDLPNKLEGTRYEIIVTKPNGDFAIPAPGTVRLSGGAEKIDATAASATVLAS